jgi:hypothetical protein
MEEFASSVTPIESMVDYFTGGDACSSRHHQRYIEPLDPVKKRFASPLIPP